MIIDELIKKILSGINPGWDNLHKIRYVYIELGKVLSKDTDFFFSVENKLDTQNLSEQEILDIYNSDSGRNMEVICKSSALILKKIFDLIGIESWLVQSNNNYQELNNSEDKNLKIYHWFLAVKDGNDIYFLTLSSDLPFIKLGMKTEHFGNTISYEKVVDGELIQVYKGEKINETKISESTLFQIDKDIGYVKSEYNYDKSMQSTNKTYLQYENAGFAMLRDALKNGKLYYELELYDTDFYKEMTVFDKSKGKSIFGEDYLTATVEETNLWKRRLCKFVLNKIEELFGYEINVIPFVDSKNWNYEAWFMRLCVTIQDKLIKDLSSNKDVDINDFRIDVENFNYARWSAKLKKSFKVEASLFDSTSILLLLDKLNALFNMKLIKENHAVFLKLFNSILFHFLPLDRSYIRNIDENGFLNNSYIARKFEKLFSYVMGCNQTLTDFNFMGYSEQVVIIKQIIELIFPEVTYDNSCSLKEYDKKYSPILNRIHLYHIKNKSTGDYAIVFNVLGTDKDSDYYFFYDPKANSFEVCDIFNIATNYILISERMKDRISLADMESFSLK